MILFVSIFLNVILDDKLKIARETACKYFNDKKKIYKPHLSLAYGNFSFKQKEIAINSNQTIECDVQPNLKIKDLTGAGDLFAAGYLHGVINNLSVKESLVKGTELSSKIIQKIGARI